MKKNTKYLLVGVAFLIGLFVITYGATYAKYTSNSIWNYYLKSRGFYFTSKDLDTTNYINNNWDGGSTYFSIQNYISDEDVTDYDINYSVTCEVLGDAASYSKCIVNKSDENTFDGVLTGGVGKMTKDISFDVVPTSNREITGVSVVINVTSTSPFKKKLSNTFILNKGESKLGSIDVNYNEEDYYSSVVVTNSYNEDKCVKLSWNVDDLRIDLDNDLVKNIVTNKEGYINEISFNIEHEDSMNFIFYRTNNNVHLTKNVFTITQSNDC